ncbi:MAG: diadenylate cyclase CdaA [Clostridia bacterium]|nr:diadenylate cyclase CdaA [Clostridia bacterium]
MGVFSWEAFRYQLLNMNILDVIDIVLIAIMMYFVYAFIRDRRAGKLAVGVGVLIAIMLVGSLIGLRAVSFIMTNLFQVGFVALVIVFQPELRAALEKMGGDRFKNFIPSAENKDHNDRTAVSIREISTAAAQLGRSRTGALIVIERTTKLGDITNSGVTVNADISSFMLRNIFYEGAPLHDGAVIIRDWRIASAGCFLPLSSNEAIIKDLGTRHRAGIGISEESDAVVIIVSEETGTISVAMNGQLKRGFTHNSLKKELEARFHTEGDKGVQKIFTHKKDRHVSKKGGRREWKTK